MSTKPASDHIEVVRRVKQGSNDVLYLIGNMAGINSDPAQRKALLKLHNETKIAKFADLTDKELVLEFVASLKDGRYPGDVLKSPHVIEAVRRIKEEDSRYHLTLFDNMAGANPNPAQREALVNLKASINRCRSLNPSWRQSNQGGLPMYQEGHKGWIQRF